MLFRNDKKRLLEPQLFVKKYKKPELIYVAASQLQLIIAAKSCLEEINTTLEVHSVTINSCADKRTRSKCTSPASHLIRRVNAEAWFGFSSCL